MTKYHNVKTTYNGVLYDSKGEAEYAMKLDLRKRAGDISDWGRPIALAVDDRCLSCRAMPAQACVDGKGRLLAGYHRDRMTYKPDFWILPNAGSMYYVDFKGQGRNGRRVTETAAFRIKVRQWRKNIRAELRVAYKSGEEKVVATGKEAVTA